MREPVRDARDAAMLILTGWNSRLIGLCVFEYGMGGGGAGRLLQWGLVSHPAMTTTFSSVCILAIIVPTLDSATSAWDFTVPQINLFRALSVQLQLATLKSLQAQSGAPERPPESHLSHQKSHINLQPCQELVQREASSGSGVLIGPGVF